MYTAVRAVIGLLVCAGVAAGLGWWAMRPPEPLRAFATEFALSDVTVITPEVDRREHQVLSVGDGRIREITSRTNVDGGLRIDAYRRHFVLPGLIDLHAHLPPASVLDLTSHALLLQLAFGVTTIREVGDVDGTAVPAAREGMAAGRFPGPTIYACGPFIAGGEPRWKNTRIMQGPADAESIVAGLRRDGFDCIKSYDDLTAAEISALVVGARRHGMPLLGHLPAGVSFEDSEVAEVQHLQGVVERDHLRPNDPMSRAIDWEAVDDRRIDEFVRLSQEKGIAHTPTLISSRQLLRYADYEVARRDPIAALLPRLYRDVVWDPTEGLPMLRELTPVVIDRLRAAFEKKKEVVRRLDLAGVEVHIGTDVMQPLVVPGISVQQEMRLFVESGVPLGQVWAIATWRGGDALRVPQLGRLERGAPADFLVFREDPTRNLEALDTLVAVVAQGRLYRREDLDAALARYGHHFENPIFDQVSVAATKRILQGAVAGGSAAPMTAHPVH